MELVVTIIIAAGIPSAVVGIILRRFEKRQDKRDAAREEINVLLIQGVNASISLGEATTIALRNGKTNGETEAALKYAKDSKHEITDFLTRQGVQNIV